MSHIQKFAHVNYSQKQMYDLVNDFEQYPEFLPGCMGARTITRTDREIVATLEVGKGPVRQSFTTRNVLTEPSLVEMSLVEGPFKRLQGEWTFEPLSETTCKIALSIDFELKGMLKFAFGGVFGQVANAMVEAFSERAKVVYG
ncbi:type II toxin-antitoxin system RatA family toxin [Marinomonas atlantica]|uniref:type II toxin-antitoxin system RatA family toxin n=1 Tax=Marinomonas atlantica TaxID=1806668 RepID=UPI0009ED216C|nr:type II toxin-antitoxin system RatA family toxin [Marinomonas atlantica]MCO4785567.1 type II toxin-antitoxin system RatA family toxin [Marinomonas atlantica]